MLKYNLAMFLKKIQYSISGWYCKLGVRAAGCCAHVSVLWYLGYDRNHPHKLPSSFPKNPKI